MFCTTWAFGPLLDEIRIRIKEALVRILMAKDAEGNEVSVRVVVAVPIDVVDMEEDSDGVEVKGCSLRHHVRVASLKFGDFQGQFHAIVIDLRCAVIKMIGVFLDLIPGLDP